MSTYSHRNGIQLAITAAHAQPSFSLARGRPSISSRAASVSMHSKAAKPKTEAAPGKAAAPIEQSNACTERKPRESFRLREKAAASEDSAVAIASAFCAGVSSVEEASAGVSAGGEFLLAEFLFSNKFSIVGRGEFLLAEESCGQQVPLRDRSA